ncbi:unnamed protein product [Ectocarpus fasciculatus]
MLVGRVFGGLPNGRLGRPSIKAGGRSTGFPAVRVDPVTEPSTPSPLRRTSATSRPFPGVKGGAPAVVKKRRHGPACRTGSVLLLAAGTKLPSSRSTSRIPRRGCSSWAPCWERESERG